MKIITSPIFLEHNTGTHPERRERLLAFQQGKTTDLDLNVEEEIMTIHHTGYLKRVQSACTVPFTRLDSDTVVGPGSYEAARGAVRAALLAADQSDLALVRPPGHHAYPGHASGFCLFNSIAIATEYLARQGKRVVIFDFDGHMGDGTSSIFYERNDVLFWSLHQYPAFPGMGKSDEIGRGLGYGYSIQVPLPPGSGDDMLLDGIEKFWPVMMQFNPDVIAVSAGFDGHKDDPLLQLNFSTQVFYWVGRKLAWSKIPIFAILEGGYNIEILPLCIYNFLAGINDEEIPFPSEATKSSANNWSLYENDLQLGLRLLNQVWNL